jgi:NAD(P)-dependent dehydrogenase (short-subunit alcohol dehydrogenase family)
MQDRVKDKVAIVTGGARGIGQAIARRLVEEGAKVWVADIDEAVAHQAAASMERMQALRLDISDDASVASAIEEVRKCDQRLDILVNNAAIFEMTSLEHFSMDSHVRILEVNLNGALRMTVAALPLLRSSGSGRVLNIASVNGLRGSAENLSYSTAKGGIVNMTRCLASDLAPFGITVNAIAPGFINTRMSILPDGSGHEHETATFKEIYIKNRRIPLARAGTPEDVAGPALFFCSDDSRYVTGHILPVDGGMLTTL